MDATHRGQPLSRQPIALIVVTTVTLLLPFASFFYVTALLLTGNFWWPEPALLLAGLTLTLLGTGLGFHRYFSHRAFRATRPLKIGLGILGCAGGLGLVTWFSAIHREHHRYADTARDPHSPNFPEPKGLFAHLVRLWTSAWGFSYLYALYSLHLVFPDKDKDGISKPFRASVRDLTDDPDIRFVDNFYYLWIALSFLLPGALLASLGGSFLNGVLWGGLARMGANQLIFGFINVMGHKTGAQPFQCGDTSRNLYWFAPFSSGESLHNNHHAFPWTAKTTLAWWQLDLNWYFLVLFEKLGWASDVRVPQEAEIKDKLRPT